MVNQSGRFQSVNENEVVEEGLPLPSRPIRSAGYDEDASLIPTNSSCQEALDLGRFSRSQSLLKVLRLEKSSDSSIPPPSASPEKLIRGRYSASRSYLKPTFKIKIQGFQKRNSSLLDAILPSAKVFDFTVPLPTPFEPTFYSMPNDAPCLRGGTFSKDFKIKEDKLGRLKWDRLASNSKVLVHSPSISHQGESRKFEGDFLIAKKSTKMVNSRWNSRINRILTPPWLPLNEGDAEATATLQTCLSHFVNDDSGKFGWLDCSKWLISSKWLIAPQSMYDWDGDLLLKELHSLVQEVNEANPASKPITHLELEVQALTPFFTHHVQPDLQSLRRRFTELVPALVCCTFVPGWLLITFVNLAAPFTDEKFYWTALIGLVLYSIGVPIMLFGELQSIHTSIGLAWSMKKWVKLNLPHNMSETDVKEILRGQSGGDRVKPSDDGWYRSDGEEEGDWVKRHEKKLKVAFRERKKGDISDEWW